MKTINNTGKKKLKLTSFEKLEDKFFGKKETAKRRKYETELNEEIKSNISKMENNIKSLRMDTFIKVLKALQTKMTIRLEFDKIDKKLELV